MSRFGKIWNFWFFFSLYLVIDFSLSFFPPIKFWVNFFFDDGCFYIKTAYNFAIGLGSTFDGVNITNGYQPLWFIILAAVFYMVHLFAGNCSPQFLLRITIFVHLLLFYFTFYFTYKSFKLLFQNDSIKRCLLLCVSLCITPIFVRNMGMEMSLTAFLFSVYFWTKCRELKLNEYHIAANAVLFILISFTRIDFSFLLVPILVLYECYNRNLKIFSENLIKIALPVTAAVSTYFLFNYFYFGHLLTVSGVIKSTFPNIIDPDVIIYHFSYTSLTSYNVLLCIALSSFIGFKLYLKKSFEYRKIEMFLFWIMMGFTAFIFQNALFNRDTTREWYFAGPIYISALLITITSRKRKYFALALSLFFLTVFATYTYYARLKVSKFDSLYEYAMELKELVPENEEIIQVDYSGLIGLFSERKVVNGDGLINSFEYHDYVIKNKVPEFIKKYHIDYLSTYMAVIDSTTNTVTDKFCGEIGGWQLTFPVEKIKYRKLQNFDSPEFGRTYEWFLISLK